MTESQAKAVLLHNKLTEACLNKTVLWCVNDYGEVFQGVISEINTLPIVYDYMFRLKKSKDWLWTQSEYLFFTYPAAERKAIKVLNGLLRDEKIMRKEAVAVLRYTLRGHTRELKSIDKEIDYYTNKIAKLKAVV